MLPEHGRDATVSAHIRISVVPAEQKAECRHKKLGQETYSNTSHPPSVTARIRMAKLYTEAKKENMQTTRIKT